MSQKSSILIVDDEPNIRFTLSMLLKRAGHEVTEAEHGLEAVEFLNRRGYDLMIVDLKMPGMGGMQVVAEARKLHADMAIIVLTGIASGSGTSFEAALLLA